MATGRGARIRELFRPTVVVHPPTVVVNPPAPEPEDLLEAALELAQTQILGQLEQETSIDGQTIGILAFLGALLAVDVAAKDVLGNFWWTPLVPVVAGMLPCFLSIFAGPPFLGPRAVEFYKTYGGHPSRAAREQLLADLGSHFAVNGVRATEKRLRLRQALVITFVGLVVAGLLITLDRPTTMKNNGNQGQSKASARNSRAPFSGANPGARALRAAPGHAIRLGR